MIVTCCPEDFVLSVCAIVGSSRDDVFCSFDGQQFSEGCLFGKVFYCREAWGERMIV